jgi:hypothetical protein
MRLAAHNATSVIWCPVPQDTLAPSVQDEQGHPEHIVTLLPSSYPPQLVTEQVHGPIMQTEREFRRVNCLKSLQTLRSLAMQHAHFTIAKAKHAKGIKAVTRADSQAQRLQTKIEQVHWEYSHSRARLKDLGMTPQDIKTFQPFCANDIRELKQMALKHESLG